MASIEAVPVAAVGGAMTTDDGKVVLLRLNLEIAGEKTFALPVIEVPRLIDAICGSLASAMKAQGTGTVIVTEATWFEFGRGPQGEDVLGMTFGAGGKLWFRLPKGMLENMRDVLNAGAEPSTVQRPDSKPN